MIQTPSTKEVTPREALINAHVAFMRKTSTMPDTELIAIARNKPRKIGTTNGITNAIIDYVKYIGGYSNRISSSGRKIKTKGGKDVFIRGTTRSGTADIDIVYMGLPIKVEVKNKATKDRISDEQRKERERVEAAGAIYMIAESFDTWYYDFHKLISDKLPNRA